MHLESQEHRESCQGAAWRCPEADRTNESRLDFELHFEAAVAGILYGAAFFLAFSCVFRQCGGSGHLFVKCCVARVAGDTAIQAPLVV